MVRECSPPAREPAMSWLARRSTIATSTSASASSAANISPVGPPPAITTAWSVNGIPLGAVLQILIREALGRPRQPCLDDDLLEIVDPDRVEADQDGRVAVEVRRREEDARVVMQQRL